MCKASHRVPPNLAFRVPACVHRNRASYIAQLESICSLVYGAVLMGKTRTRRAGADWDTRNVSHTWLRGVQGPPEIRARESFSQSASSKRDVLWPRQDTKTTTTPDLANEKGDSLHRRTTAAPPAGRRVSPPQQTSRKSHPSGLSPFCPIPLGPLAQEANGPLLCLRGFPSRNEPCHGQSFSSASCPHQGSEFEQRAGVELMRAAGCMINSLQLLLTRKLSFALNRRCGFRASNSPPPTSHNKHSSVEP